MVTAVKDYPVAQVCTDVQVTQLSNLVTSTQGGPATSINASNPNVRVFFTGFDGTGNNRDNPAVANTNVVKLTELAEQGLRSTGGGRAEYYAGPGTQDNVAIRKLDSLSGATMVTTAGKAYSDLVQWANQEYASNGNVEIALAGASFSRGGGTHTVYLNMVYERGIPDTSSPAVYADNPYTGVREVVGYERYVVPPGQANLGSHVFYDRVVTGGRTAVTTLLPASAKLQVLSIGALDEHRMDFAFDSLQNSAGTDWRVSQYMVAGAHSNIGGGEFVNGIAQYTLKAATGWLTAGNVRLAPIAATDLPGTQSCVISDSYKGFWNGYEGGPDKAGWIGVQGQVSHLASPAALH